jgi:hypothetical protein
MKHVFATVVVVFAIAGCTTGQGVATGGLADLAGEIRITADGQAGW